MYELNLAGETDGLRGRKDNLWEGGIRVPAIIKYGKHLPQGMVSDTPVYGLDWMPTLAKNDELSNYLQTVLSMVNRWFLFLSKSIETRKAINFRD